MPFDLKNTARLIDSRGSTDWWSWTAFIEPSGDASLDDVKYVEYILHPSFPNPIRRVRSPQDGFALTTKGWGVFPLTARVVFKDTSKNTIELEHYLQFK